jgi:GLTT repeat (6 copies)
VVLLGRLVDTLRGFAAAALGLAALGLAALGLAALGLAALGLAASGVLAWGLAEAVAVVAADVIFVAAEVTLAAADDTVLAAVTCAVARGAADLVRVDVVRAAGRDRFAAAGFAVALDFGLVPARLTTALLRALDRAVFAAPRRAGLRAVVCRGIDLPPVVINFERRIPRLAATYTSKCQ